MSKDTMSVAYLLRVRILRERLEDPGSFPFNLPFARDLDVTFDSAVTFLVGENGSGKSTFIEAVASLCGLPASGGGKNELTARTGSEVLTPLAAAFRPSFRQRPKDAYFFRAEHMAHFADLLDARKADPDFWGDPYARYGGQSLHTRSYGEAFLSLFDHRLEEGFFLLDEPESALSPQRQLSLLARMAELLDTGRAQFLIATHSPILLTFPGATILGFDGRSLARLRLEETSHYQITRGILESPERYWKHLRRS